jgi:hypothetical protein
VRAGLLRVCGELLISTDDGIRPVDYIGPPMVDMDVCSTHAELLIERERTKGLEVSIRD